jgi:hypothetical protein
MTPSRTKAELAERAAELDVDGRSSMTRDELEAAVADAESRQAVVAAAPPVADEAAVVPETSPQEKPQSVRGSLVQVAQERAANVHVRVIGAGPEEA